MQVPLRDPKIVMKLSRLGSFHQSKLSFLRSFLNEFKDWKYNRDLFDLNDRGYGVAIYSFSKDKKTYSLVCFANELKDEERSDRVIATKWDAAFALYDGIPSKIDIDRLSQNVPKQEVGRLSYKELTLSRANRSVRAFNYVVECLSKGIQPNTNELSKVGYLYRTTAVYGSGKFGLADRFRIKNRDEINGPFRLEMMLVYLVRQFTFDQVNHIAKHKNPKDAVELDLDICRNLGIGNSTGLGMAPFIVNHPSLLNNWILAKETALKKIREIEKVSEEEFKIFYNCLTKSLKDNIDKSNFYIFDKLYNWAEENLSEEGVEYLVSIMMEPYNEITDPLISQMSSDEDSSFNIPVDRTINDLREIIEKNYSDILKIDFSKNENNKKFWFISKNKEEPRIGDRFEDNGSELEQPTAIARDIKKLYETIFTLKNSLKIGNFLVHNNDLRHIVRRVFITEKYPYSEIQDNTIGSKLVPIDMLRLKLSFFGAVKFDPRSDKWLRICMFQGAPLPNELNSFNQYWIYN
jgi:hypothetical protein